MFDDIIEKPYLLPMNHDKTALSLAGPRIEQTSERDNRRDIPQHRQPGQIGAAGYRIACPPGAGLAWPGPECAAADRAAATCSWPGVAAPERTGAAAGAQSAQ